VVWFTGLPGSGKTTLAYLLQKKLIERELQVEVLDGDAVRRQFRPELGFSRADREINMRRIGHFCDGLSRKGVVAIAAGDDSLRCIYGAPFLF
jgi:adenylylsulfate kinase-like enzyme